MKIIQRKYFLFFNFYNYQKENKTSCWKSLEIERTYQQYDLRVELQRVFRYSKEMLMYIY